MPEYTAGMNREALHDSNEKARRGAEREAMSFMDEEVRQSTLQFITQMYDLIARRIDRGVYDERKKEKVA